MRLITYLFALLIMATGGISSPLSANTADIRLPDIGDPADTVLSLAEERQLGTIILAQVRNGLPVIDDPELNSYINNLGTRLVTEGLYSNLEYHFLMVADSAINAFATPGGVVVVYSGLLLTAENEAELAGVMGHEIAHVSQRHMARTYANQKQITIATALGILGAIAAGIAGQGDMAAAAIQGTMAASAQAQLAFSRGNEQEADRVGMQLLVNAGYDPNGMPRFFERLQKANELNAGPAMEFLSTHPVTSSRISDTRNRAAQIRNEHTGHFVNDTERFRYARARALAMTKPASEITAMMERLESKSGGLDDITQYAYGVALTRTGDTRKAIGILTALNKTGRTGGIWVPLALARAYIEDEQPRKAETLLRRLNQVYPSDEAIVYYLAKSLIAQGRGLEANRILSSIPDDRIRNPSLYQLRARAAAQSDQPWLSHESMADYYIEYGQYSAALEQLELALTSGNIDTVAQARIRSKRKHLRSILTH